jgi:hypothetical protein
VRESRCRARSERHSRVHAPSSGSGVRLMGQRRPPLQLRPFQPQYREQGHNDLGIRYTPPHLDPRHRRLRHPRLPSQLNARQPRQRPKPPNLLPDRLQPVIAHNRALHYPTTRLAGRRTKSTDPEIYEPGIRHCRMGHPSGAFVKILQMAPSVTATLTATGVCFSAHPQPQGLRVPARSPSVRPKKERTSEQAIAL